MLCALVRRKGHCSAVISREICDARCPSMGQIGCEKTSFFQDVVMSSKLPHVLGPSGKPLTSVRDTGWGMMIPNEQGFGAEPWVG